MKDALLIIGVGVAIWYLFFQNPCPTGQVQMVGTMSPQNPSGKVCVAPGTAIAL